MTRPPPILATIVAVLAVAPTITSAWVLRSAPGFYPGDRDGWRQLGWADSDRFFRYSYNGCVGRWSAGCFGCGVWIPDAAPSGFQSCGPCAAWDGSRCTQAPSGACTAGIGSATCGPCTYWENGGCVAAAGCGVDFCGGGGGGASAAAASSSGGGSTVVTSNGGNTVFYSSPSGGGVATSSGGGSSFVATGGGGGSGAATPGGAAAFAGPGGAMAWPGK